MGQQGEQRMPGRTLRSLVIVGLLGLAGAAQAAITVYTSQAAFLAAVTAPGIDTFIGFSITVSTPSPINRTAGPYSYTAAVSTTSFFGAGTTADPWLSTNTATDTITFNAFPANVRAIGGFFFGSNISGNSVTGDITVVATDGGGTSMQTIVGATTSSFRGFVSTGPLTSLTVTSVQPASGILWPTVNDFILATSAPPAALVSAASRKVHGAAGTFDLPLTLTPLTNPTTEPRQGATATVVMTFNKAITAATAAVTEGAALPTSTNFSGNDVIVNIAGLADQQYSTVSLTNVTGADGSTGGTGVVRIGFLLGDVNQSRVVSVADLGLVNAQLSQPVTALNFLKDVNVTGTLTVGDKGITNANLTKALPAP
jgi:hypothetical protein